MDPTGRADMVREGSEMRPWGESQLVGIDSYKALVWTCAIATPWLAIATVALVSFRALG
jgi:hypothetical protein